MTTLSEYFERRGREMLLQLDQQLQQLPMQDVGALHRVVRELRGTAQMAREERVTRAVAAFESVVRGIAHNALTWSDDIARRARETAADLRVLVEHSANDDELDTRADAVVARWADGAPALGPTAPASDQSAGSEFREFVAREVAAIADALESGVKQLTAAPMDRQPLRSILQRQRALLGAARLDEVPVVAEILRAVEDLTRVIVKLDVGVKEEWLDIYRVARDGLRNSAAELEQGHEPQPSNALRRIRHLREELLERYGAGEIVSAAAASAGLVPATAVNVPPEHVDPEPSAHIDSELTQHGADEPPELLLDEPFENGPDELDDDDDVDAIVEQEDELPIDDLVYSGDAALERALALREVVDRATAHDPVARDVVDELFDLIRLARG
jgi:chemotaxis protein histidine kinase CheA